MPIPSHSRYEQSLTSSPSMYSTPSRSKHVRNAPSTSYSPTLTPNGQHKLNVVTRIAIEGKVKQGQDGASVRMFLKICLPLDSVTPGSTIPLFPEEDVKIHTSQVHPLDQNSVPYNFSTSVSPLLHNAARALNLPARSQENFASAFNLEVPKGTNGHASTNRSFKSESVENIPPIDVQYTGHIIVSGYSISFVLPKVFLSRRSSAGASSDTEDMTSRTPASRRRPSIGERNQAQFMAAIDMWVPFISKPPRFPYLLSIPTPRCLHNQIKLRIFPPSNAATSFASLSSIEEDNYSWDLTSEPHVTRNLSSRLSRTHSHTHFADDESSDASTTGMSEGCVVQGTFPSAEHIRIRWAKPIKNLNIAGEDNGRRRVGVEVVKGEMTCIIRGKGISASNAEVQGVLLHVEYKAQCKGIWFPGVATLLGLDVGLEAKGSDIFWPKGFPTQWEVSGGPGYTGFDNGSRAAPPDHNSRTSSTDSNATRSQSPLLNGQESAPFLTSRVNTSSSLLRAPLPAQNVADYSFEGSQGTMPSASETLSSISSLPTSSTPALPPIATECHPGLPVTLHLNMNELKPPVKNNFAFKITGTILVTSRATLARINNLTSSAYSDKNGDPDPVALPRFTVLAADSETTSITVRSEAESASVEVFHPTGDIHNDPQTRKTVLQKGGFTRCGEDGGRIAIKTLDAFNMATNAKMNGRPRTLSGTHRALSNSVVPRTLPPISKQATSSMLPWVKAVVTALAPDANLFPTGYAVRLTLQTPALPDSEWLEFGLGQSKRVSAPTEDKPQLPRIRILCATLDGVPVKAETGKTGKREQGMAPFEGLSGNDPLCWGKVYTGGLPGGDMTIDYIVKQDDLKSTKGRSKSPHEMELDVILPFFLISVARLEVKIDVMPGLQVFTLHSNFDHQHAYAEYNRLLRYSVEEFSQPQLTLMLHKGAQKPNRPTAWLKSYLVSTGIIMVIALCALYHIFIDMQHIRQTLDKDGHITQIDSLTSISTVTVTTTICSATEMQKAPTAYTTTSLSTSTLYDTTTHVPISTLTPPAVPAETAVHGNDLNINDSQSTLMISHPQSILERYGLVPVHKLFIFEWADDGETSNIKRTVGKVVEAVEVIWNVLRKAYHYPVTPP